VRAVSLPHAGAGHNGAVATGLVCGPGDHVFAGQDWVYPTSSKANAETDAGNYIQLYPGNTSLLAGGLKVIQQASGVILAGRIAT
jgi:hypothetical protein